MQETRQLKDLVSVGPATLKDFELLGISSVEQLIDKEPEDLYEEIKKRFEQKIDICLLDVFRVAIEQARNPSLPHEKCQWYYWSKIRKSKK